MLIYPALDLLDGKCVRLLKGDFDQKTVYSEDPFSLVKTFESAGATALHLVDLSGAKDPLKRQISIIEKLVKQTRLKIQTGGGIRSIEEVKALLEVGVDRVVLGSIAVSKPELVQSMLREFGPSRLTLAIDVIPVNGDMKVAVNGWKTVTDTTLNQLIESYESTNHLQSNQARILCTDISLDGMMLGPNVELYRALLQRFPGIDFQASGGISKPQDLDDLHAAGVKSLVMGKALYEGKIDLSQALKKQGVTHVD